MEQDLASQCDEIGQAGWTLYYDVSTLLEENWTGIPVVAAALARALLRWLPGHTQFFHEYLLVDDEAVLDALSRGSGVFLQNDLAQGRAVKPLPLLDQTQPSAGLYPSVKRVSQLFAVECSLYHDVSTLITPQFHVIENIRHHSRGLLDDIRTNSVTFGVSEATVGDLRAYLGADAQRTFVACNGVEWPWWYEVQAGNEVAEGRVEPYLLVLGTLEPRKNLARVFEMLAIFPEVLETWRVVVAGKTGWLQERNALPPVLEDAVRRGRILFPGFITEFEKYKLLRFAEASIYPSFFEGFGLPVLESLSVNTPCIASFSSSIPEVGGNACIYFDPFSAESLFRALRHVERAQMKQSPGFLAACASLRERFTWDNMLAQILSRLLPEMRRYGADQWAAPASTPWARLPAGRGPTGT